MGLPVVRYSIGQRGAFFIICLMKKILIVVAFLIVAGLAWFLLYSKGTLDYRTLEPADSQETESTLFTVADDANMVMVASVGLGNQERRKVISGRLYRNFVQLLKTNGVMDDGLNFSEDCNTGARLEFYSDTVLMGEFRLTDRIGKDSAAGVWLPRRISKVYKFLRDQGAQLVACGDNHANVGDLLENMENHRPTLTVPKFGETRKAKKNLERDSVRDSVARTAVDLSKLDSSVEGKAKVALSLLDEMLTPRDTAVGTPLKDLIKNVDGAEIFAVLDSNGGDQSVAKLTKEQLDELKSILGGGKLETFESGGRMMLPQKLKIVLRVGEEVELELVSPSFSYNYFVKRIRNERGILDFGGVWLPKNSEALKSFFSIFPADL